MAKAQIPDLTSTSSLGSSDEVMVRQGVSDKRIRLQLAEILAWATRNGYNYAGDYTTDPELTSTDDFAVYSGLVYFGASGLSYPYTMDSTTYPDPDSDTNLQKVVEANTKTTGGYLENIVEDTTPQLGGNLDTNGYNISDSSGSVTIEDSLVVTGTVEADSGAMTVKALTDANNVHYWLHRYDDTPIGLFFANPTEEATYVRKYDVDGTTVTSELKLTDGFANVVNCVLQEQGSRVYSANNNNIGTGSTNYAAGDHTHDADEVSAPALIGFTTDASEGSTTLTASHFNSGTIFNQTSGGEKSFTLPAGLTGIVGRAIEVLSLSALTYVYFPSGVTLTTYTPDDGGFSGGGGEYSTYVIASYSFQYFKIICVADDEYAVVGYMRYT